MRVSKKLGLVLLLITFSVITKAQTWNKKADFIGADRYGAYSFSLNGKVYLGGGIISGIPANDWYEYDIATDKWTAQKGLPRDMAEGVAFTINGKGYVGLGKTGSTYQKSLWEYDPSNDSWTQKADIPYYSGLFRCRSFVVNSKAYVLAGTNKYLTPQNDFYEYDPATDTWTQKSDFPDNGRPDLPFAFAINNKGYIACGLAVTLSGTGSEYSKRTYEYDPATDKWTQKADFPGDGRQMGVAFVYNNKAYCGLGTYKDASYIDVYLNDFYIYDATSDSWIAGTSFPGGKLRRSTAVTTSKNAYVGTGEGPGTSRSWYEFGNPLGINGIEYSNKVLPVYPNPAKNELIVNLNGVANSKYIIYNSMGQKIKEGNISNNKINISSLVNGIYFLEVQNDERIFSTHISIHK